MIYQFMIYLHISVILIYSMWQFFWDMATDFSTWFLDISGVCIYIYMYVCVHMCVHSATCVFYKKRTDFSWYLFSILNIHIPTICFIEYEICIILLNIRYVICVTNMPIDIVFNKFKSSNETQNFNKILHESHGPFSNLMGTLHLC